LLAEMVRWCGSDFSLLTSECDMERESLLVLLWLVSRQSVNMRGQASMHTWSAGSRGSLCYPFVARSDKKTMVEYTMTLFKAWWK
jgi:hypothetical protein